MVAILTGCASATGPMTPFKFNTNDAESLPLPEPKKVVPPPEQGKVVVAVYSFKDLTGQRDRKSVV